MLIKTYTHSTVYSLFILFLFTAHSTLLAQSNSIHFDGVNDKTNCGNSSSLQITGNQITLEAWIYPTSWTTSVWMGTVIVKEDNSNDSGYLLRVGESGKVNFNLGNGGWNEFSTPANTLSLNTWQHIAGVYDGSEMKIYVNGIPIDSMAFSQNIGNANASLGIGGHVTSNRHFNGRIDEARIWNIARTQSEIIANMNNEFCPTLPNGLVAYYSFNQGTTAGNNAGETTLYDLSGNGNDATLTGLSLSGNTSNWVAGQVFNPGVSFSTDVQSACNSYTWQNGTTYTISSDTAEYVLTNASGCDSIITLDLTIIDTAYGIQTVNTCFNSFTWSNGVTYTSNNNTATQLLTSSAGCDSIVTLDLTFLPLPTKTDVITACDTFTWRNGITYSSSNQIATDTIYSGAACDSVVYLDLTIKYSTYADIYDTACDSYTWIDGNTYTFDNNTATYYIANSAGCDSNMTLNLTVNYSNSATDTLSACTGEDIVWIDGNTYTTDNNTATYTLPTVNGCDSIVTLDLTFQTVDVGTVTNGISVSAVAFGPGITYQWIDCDNGNSILNGEINQILTPTSNGNYAVIVTENNCSDTSQCFQFTNVGIDEVKTAEGWNIFPNPSNGHINITNQQLYTDVTVVVRDIKGAVVKTSTFVNSQQIFLNLDDISEGIYLIEISTENKITTKKLIKL